VAVVSANDVPRAGRGAAEGGADGARQVGAGPAVGNDRGAGGIGAEEVDLDDVVVAVERDAIVGVAGDDVARAGGGAAHDDVVGDVRIAADDVARAGGGAADGDVGRAVGDVDAHPVRHRNSARNIGPDVIPLHEGAGGGGGVDEDAVARVAGDRVPGRVGRA